MGGSTVGNDLSLICNILSFIKDLFDSKIRAPFLHIHTCFLIPEEVSHQCNPSQLVSGTLYTFPTTFCSAWEVERVIIGVTLLITQ